MPTKPEDPRDVAEWLGEEAPCPCNDRYMSACPGAWEPGCDLGSNPKYARAVPDTDPAETIAALNARVLSLEAEVDRLRLSGVENAHLYLAITDAMGYDAGPQMLSPEEFAAGLRAEVDRLRKDAERDSESRLMLVARLEALRDKGDGWRLTVGQVLAILNDCDLLAGSGRGDADTGAELTGYREEP